MSDPTNDKAPAPHVRAGGFIGRALGTVGRVAKEFGEAVVADIDTALYSDAAHKVEAAMAAEGLAVVEHDAPAVEAAIVAAVDAEVPIAAPVAAPVVSEIVAEGEKLAAAEVDKLSKGA